jgi:DNA-binding HxlR family transcriptional regulator
MMRSLSNRGNGSSHVEMLTQTLRAMERDGLIDRKVLQPVRDG